MLAAVIEAILEQVFEIVFLVVGYSTGIVLIKVISLGSLHIADKTDERPPDLLASKKAEGWHITYVEADKRYVVDWFVCWLGIFFWIDIGLIVFRLIVS